MTKPDNLNKVKFTDLEQVVCNYDKCVMRGNYWRCYFDMPEKTYKQCDIYQEWMRYRKDSYSV